MYTCMQIHLDHTYFLSRVIAVKFKMLILEYIILPEQTHLIMILEYGLNPQG